MASLRFANDAVCQALVCEYLRVHSCDETLRAFKREKERVTGGISRRSVLLDALGIERDDVEWKRHTAATPKPSVLSALVELQRSRGSYKYDVEGLRNTGSWRIGTRVSSEEDGRRSSSAERGRRSEASGLERARRRSASVERTRPPRRDLTKARSSPSAFLKQISARTANSGNSSSSSASSSALAAIRDQLKADVRKESDHENRLPEPPPPTSKDSVEGEWSALSDEEIARVNQLLWGSCVAPESWKQGLYFNSTAGSEFGLAQQSGGPCGVLAAIQAHLIAESMSQAKTRRIFWSFDFLDAAVQQARLVDALVATLQQAAAEDGSVYLVASRTRQTADLDYSALLQELQKQRLPREAPRIKNALHKRLSQYQEHDGWGLALFLLSLILTKRPDEIRREMDDSEMSLVGELSYCSQELVNLLLTGSATTNVFDGDKSFGDADSSDAYLLKGIQKRSKLGLLTLLEWHGYKI